jgi:hypothetical protein
MLKLLQVKDRRVGAYRIGYDADLKRYTRPAWITYVSPTHSARFNFRGTFLYPLRLLGVPVHLKRFVAV